MTKKRSYADWKRDVGTTSKSVVRLGNELRDRWDDWKRDAPYANWDACLMAELGITAESLRLRNYRDRKSATVSSRNGGTPQPVRQMSRHSRPAEVERRAPIAARLWGEGYSREAIAAALDVGTTTVTKDLASVGVLGGPRRGRAMKQDIPEGDYRWRDEDMDDDGSASSTEQLSFASCETPDVAEVIEDVRNQLALILGGRYRLGLKDRNHLIQVLENALERTRNGQDQNTQGALRRSRVAG